MDRVNTDPQANLGFKIAEMTLIFIKTMSYV